MYMKLVVSLFFISAGSLAANPSSEAIDRSVERVMTNFSSPGMTVSIVENGHVVYSKGHGVLEVGKTEEVNDQTLFQIASISKAFTAAALAILVDEGKLNWDDPVIDHMPEFQMYDPWVTREFTVRDLLTHRSGLPLGAGDLLSLPPGNTSRQDIIRALRYLKPSSSFRSKYDYDNLMYVVAGELVSRLSESSFEDFVEKRIFLPLGMTDCHASLERAEKIANRATPHVTVNEGLEVTHSLATPEAAPAGGVNCNASSMAKWMRFILEGGVTSDGVRLISEEQFSQWMSPVTLTTTPAFLVENANSFITAYSLGWFVSSFYGQPLIAHGGGLWGMTSYILIFPRLDLAFFASSNTMSVAPRALIFDLAHQYLSDWAPDRDFDWIALFEEQSNQEQEDADRVVEEAFSARNELSNPSLPLSSYAGVYRDAWYGDIHISVKDDGRLWFHSARSTGLKGPLEHFQYDTFVARWTNRKLMADAYVSFTLTPEGSVSGISMKAVSPNTDFSFDFHDLDLRFVEPLTEHSESHPK